MTSSRCPVLPRDVSKRSRAGRLHPSWDIERRVRACVRSREQAATMGPSFCIWILGMQVHSLAPTRVRLRVHRPYTPQHTHARTQGIHKYHIRCEGVRTLRYHLRQRFLIPCPLLHTSHYRLCRSHHRHKGLLHVLRSLLGRSAHTVSHPLRE